MRRRFAEIDDNGVVIDVHEEDARGKTRKRKASHKLTLNGSANKGDRWSDKHGCFLRPLQRTDDERERIAQKHKAQRERDLRRAAEKDVSVTKHLSRRRATTNEDDEA